MITLDEQLASKLARVRLVLMDIDGTLIDADHPTFENVVDQLRKLKPLGIGFSIATGRTIRGASFVRQRLTDIGAVLPPMITYNGAVVLSADDSRIVTRHLIDRAAFEAVVLRCRELRVEVLAYACQQYFDFFPQETVYSEGSARPEPEFNGMQIRFVKDILSVRDDFVAVLLDVANPQVRAALMADLSTEFHGRLRVTSSGSRYIEICHPRGTKRDAMGVLARIRNIEISQIMAIGDNYNDQEMISAAGVGVAVANAPAELRQAALLRPSLPSGRGVVEALRALRRAVRSQSRVERG
ncbi:MULTISPECIES: HAD-IIB family hydrolase [unclassified Bradyrhizobium]|uniref:HAD-IIB family hydrolase n=1 Tax=unclassified Bradyrhizobium TaxID=2631580 RepID=UPI002916E0D1|nr:MULTISPECIES: HAD-IIB family hydrolase [unclassified Bradyrhizobium]